jgi:hypothetical protein
MAAAFRGSQLSQSGAVSPLLAMQMKFFRTFTPPLVGFAGQAKQIAAPAATFDDIKALAN